MQVLITGGLGFIGSNLYLHLVKNGYTVYIYSHQSRQSALKVLSSHPLLKEERVSLVCANEPLPDCEIVVNLAGESIAKSFLTRKRLKAILSSRLEMLELIVKAYEKRPPLMLIGASATGIYINGGYEKLLAESFASSKDNKETNIIKRQQSEDFGLSEDAKTEKNIYASLVINIEQATASSAAMLGCKYALLRFGVVVGKEGGIMEILSRLPKFRFLPGDNFVPHILIGDAVNAVKHVIENHLTGVVNMVSPLALRLNELLELCQKQSFFTFYVPRFILHFDRRGALLRVNHSISPMRLRQSGFLFSFDELNQKIPQKSH